MQSYDSFGDFNPFRVVKFMIEGFGFYPKLLIFDPFRVNFVASN